MDGALTEGDRSNPEAVEAEFCRKIARVLKQSYRISQGSSVLQKSILTVVGENIATPEAFRWQKLDAHIVQHLRQLLAGSKSSEMPTAVRPLKEMAAGAHSEVSFSESNSAIEGYLEALRGRNIRVDRGMEIRGKQMHLRAILEDLLGADKKFMFTWISKARSRLQFEGRPGRARTTDPEGYDDYMRDKFFSYVVTFLLKNKSYPEDVDGIFDAMFSEIRELDFFKDLQRGTYPNKYIQGNFDEIVGRYNKTHKHGQVVLPRGGHSN